MVDAERLRQGDEDAFKEFVGETERLLMSVSYGILLNTEDARDAVQDAYLRFWRSRERLDPNGYIQAYLVQILKNVCLTMLKKRANTVGMDEIPEPGKKETPSSRLDEKEIISRAMTVLKEKERMIVAMIHYENMDSAEVGEILGLSASTVRSHYQSARIRMRNYITRFFPEFVR
ncbi:MAG: sigma-70 family RNA polymerase sigma factor [Acidobacteria bacterium]|nr:sigma-70 family RNA polymerase sigma factor [Acidobacteriota bacterium]